MLLPLVVFVALIAGFFWSSAPPEPVYAGKPLSQLLYDGSPDFVWIPNDVYGHVHDELWNRLTNRTNDLTSAGVGPVSQASAAGRDEAAQIGTNALPCLVHWMGRQARAWDAVRDWVGDLLPAKLGARVSSSTVSIWGERQTRWHIAAFKGFTQLGAKAEPALPALSNLLARTGGDLPLTWAIANIGPKGLAVLTNALTTSNADLRDNAALALGLQYGRAKSALPALVTCVAQGAASYHVLGAIGRIGGEDPRLVPALIKRLEATGATAGTASEEAMALLVLGLQGERSQAAIPMLVTRYRTAPTADVDSTRRFLRRVLRAISPATEGELPAPGPGETSDDWP